MTIQIPSAGQPVADDGALFTWPWFQWAQLVTRAVNHDWGSGTTADRPAGTGLVTGDRYFDTTLGLPIWWDGSAWILADGSPA